MNTQKLAYFSNPTPSQLKLELNFTFSPITRNVEMSHNQVFRVVKPRVFHCTTREAVLSCYIQLDHGKHNCTHSPTATLGTLHAFPLELQQRIISCLDIKSLLVFRSVSKSAMRLVNSLLEYQKIMAHAPTTLRMAIAIRTHHRYTISDLFAALCQRHCEDCGTLAHYACLFTCRRICLSQEKYCKGSLGPRLFRLNPWRSRLIGQGILQFSPVPGFYRHSRVDSRDGIFARLDVKIGDLYADLNHCSPLLEKNLFRYGIIEYKDLEVMQRSISAVVAPCLSKMDWGAEYGMQYQICKQKGELAIWRTYHLDSMAYIRQYDVWTKEELEKHMREEHEVVENSAYGDLTESV